MARSDALKYFQKHKAAQVSQCCWLAYNLIIMTINVAGSWNFHLDIIKPSAVLVLTMLTLAFNLGITANTAPTLYTPSGDSATKICSQQQLVAP